MPSKFTGIFPRPILTIHDFQGTPPDDVEPGIKAEAHPHINQAGATTQPFEIGEDTFYRLKDSFTVDVVFDRSASWVIPSVHKDSAPEQARLFNHEQGHYDLTALFARDYFIEMMALKDAQMSTSGEVVEAVQALHNKYPGRAQALMDLYDSELQTNHGRTQHKQDDWDDYMQTASTVQREPEVLAPDGKAYKRPILEVLEENGITL